MRRAALSFFLSTAHGLALGQFAGPFPIPVNGDAAAITRFNGYMQLRATERGMPLNANALALDGDRTLWVGLEDGLLRCDGDRHTLYQHTRKDSTSLPNNSVTDVRVAPDGGIWVGTQEGLAHLRPTSSAFKQYRLRADSLNAVTANRFWQVVPMASGGVIALNEIGVYTLTQKGEFRRIIEFATGYAGTQNRLLSDPDGQSAWIATRKAIYRLSEDGSVRELRELAKLEGLRIERPLSLAWCDEGCLLWADRERGTLVEANLETQEWREIELRPALGEDLDIRGIVKVNDGSFWMTTWNNSIHVVSAAGALHAAPFPSGYTALAPTAMLSTRNLLLDEEGRLWAATSQGVLALLPSDPRVTRLALPSIEPNRGAITMERLPHDALAIGTYRRGLLVLDSLFANPRWIAQKNPLRGPEWLDGENTISAQVALDENRILAATYHGLHEIDRRQGRYIQRSDLEALDTHLARKHFIDLVADTNGWFWAASWMNGLFRFNPERGLLKQYKHDPQDANSLPIDRLLCLLLDAEGELWIGANDGGGLARYRRGTDDFERIELRTSDTPGQAAGVIRSLARDAEGAIWLGTHKGGVVRHDPRTRRSEAFDRSQGVPGDLINAVACDAMLGTWVAGRGGLAKWIPEQRVFQRMDFGLDWTDEIHDLILVPERKELLVLLATELVRINLAATAPLRPLATPRLLNMRVNGAALGPAAEVKLISGRDRIVLEYALSDPIRAQGTRIAWRLTGLNEEWNDCLGCRSAAFNELPTGVFRFEAKVLGDDGSWTEPVTLAILTAQPPWWATWWFRVSALVVMLIAGRFAFHAYVQRRLRTQREVFEREQAVLRERERIASDMHDDLGAGLSGLKLRSEMALRVEKDPAKREHLASLAASAGELIGSMRQMIWAMDQEQGSTHDLIAYATSYARAYCAEHGLAAEVLVAESIPDTPLTAQQRRNLFLVMKEALHNCVKHAQASRIIISVNWDRGLRITIADNGIGLPQAADAGTGNGMRNMHKRMNEISGTLTLTNKRGTTVSAYAPITHP